MCICTVMSLQRRSIVAGKTFTCRQGDKNCPIVNGLIKNFFFWVGLIQKMQFQATNSRVGAVVSPSVSSTEWNCSREIENRRRSSIRCAVVQCRRLTTMWSSISKHRASESRCKVISSCKDYARRCARRRSAVRAYLIIPEMHLKFAFPLRGNAWSDQMFSFSISRKRYFASWRLNIS